MSTVIDKPRPRTRTRYQKAVHFLAQAGEILGSSLDYETTLARVTRLFVPVFADWCTVDLADAEGRLRRVSVSHVDANKVQLALDLYRRYPPDENALRGPYQVMKTGRSTLVLRITDEQLQEVARDAEHLRILRDLGLKSYISVPLAARERTIGVMSFISAESAYEYDENDLVFAEELARRAAMAVDNANLYRESQRQLAELNTLYHATPIGMCFLDRDMRFVRVNEFLAAMTGLPVAAHIGRTVREVMPLAGDMAERICHNVLRTGRPVMNAEFQIAALGASAETRDWLVNAFPVVDRQGEIIGVSGVVQDITERKRLEIRLALQYEIATLMAEAPVSGNGIAGVLSAICRHLGWDYGEVWRVNGDGTALHCDETWTEWPEHEGFARSRKVLDFRLGEELSGRVWEVRQPVWCSDVTVGCPFPRSELIAAEGFHAAIGFPIRLRGDVIGAMVFFNHRILQPNADWLKLLDALGSQLGHFIARREAEASVRESEIEKSAILDSALDAIIATDERGLVREFNPAAERMFGYARAEALGADMLELVVSARDYEKFRAMLGQDWKSEYIPALGKRFETVVRRKDGTEFPAELAITRIPHQLGASYTAIIRDLTDRKKAEADMMRAHEELMRLNQIRSDFTAMVSHELRTPLATIKEGIGIVADGIDGPVTDAQRETLRITSQSVDRLARLIQNVLTFTRIDSGRLDMVWEKVDLVQLVRDIEHLMALAAEKKAVRLEVRVPDAPVIVACDPDKIIQILINLVDNAIKFSAAGGRVVIALKHVRGSVRLIVRDQGVGIPKADQEKIFELFGHSMEKGMWRTGGFAVGLALSRRLAAQHRGTLSVQSEPGRGATFTLCFPDDLPLGDFHDATAHDAPKN